MYRKWLPVLITTVAMLSAGIWETGLSSPPEKEKSQKESKADPVKRGEYLVEFGGCHDCHTPKKFTERGPVLDESRLLSGHQANSPLPEVDRKALQPGYWVLFSPDLTAAVGPWGMSFASNLTPDPQTGIGLWTEDTFIQAMRTGLHMGAGRPILPPMPYEGVAKLTDDDLKAVFAYLKSIPPVKNAVPAPTPPNEVGN